jgi:hypothetical protein
MCVCVICERCGYCPQSWACMESCDPDAGGTASEAGVSPSANPNETE